MKRFTALLIIITLLMFGSIGMVMAQDSTPAAEDVPAATVEAGDTTVVVSDDGQTTTITVPAAESPVDDTTTLPTGLLLAGGVLVALLGAAAGGGGVFIILTRWVTKIMEDKSSIKQAELLANGAPEWAIKAGFELAKLMQAGGVLLEELTDEQPIETKTAPTIESRPG